MYSNAYIQELVKLRDVLKHPDLYGGIYEYKLGVATDYHYCLGPIDDSNPKIDPIRCIKRTAELLYQKPPASCSLEEVRRITGARRGDKGPLSWEVPFESSAAAIPLALDDGSRRQN